MSRNSALAARARRYLADAVHAFDHGPVEVTLSVLLAIAFSYALSSDAEPFREWFELGVIMLLTGSVAFTATLLHALGAWRVRTRWVVTGLGAVAAALYGVFVLDLGYAAEGWRAAALVAAGALLVLSAPALSGRSGATERFRRVTGRLLLRTIAVLLYAAALYAGLALALGAVNTLFELRLDARIYFHTFGWVFFVLVTWVVVGGVPDFVRADGDASPVAAAVHRVSAFLVTPLLAIYYLILYAYAIRIAMTGELPKNLVSPLVIAAGLIAGVALVLFDRTAGDDEGVRPAGGLSTPPADGVATSPAGAAVAAAPAGGAPAAAPAGGAPAAAPAGGAPAAAPVPFRPLRIAAPLFVPLCVLGVWAIGMRLGQYGWTEFRALRVLLLIVLGLLALGATVRIIARRGLPVHVLPLTLAGAALLAGIGPWSVQAVSRRSQQARLAAAMRDAGIEWSATALRDTIIPNEPYREIDETTRYLVSHFGPGALPPLFARHAETSGRFVDVVYAAGLRAERPELTPSRGGYGQLENGAALADGSGGTLHYIRLDLPSRPPAGGPRPAAVPSNAAPGDSAAAATADSAALSGAAADTAAPALVVRITVAGINLFADLAPVSRAIVNAPPGSGTLEPGSARVSLRDERGRDRGDLLVLEIGITADVTPRVHRLIGLARLDTAAARD